MSRSRTLVGVVSALLVVSGLLAVQPGSASAASTLKEKCTITGTSGVDLLKGTPGRDVICGLGGDDVLVGLDGDDVLIGGTGADVLFGDEGDDVLRGGSGDDQLDGGSGRNDLMGGTGRDTAPREHGIMVMVDIKWARLRLAGLSFAVNKSLGQPCGLYTSALPYEIHAPGSLVTVPLVETPPPADRCSGILGAFDTVVNDIDGGFHDVRLVISYDGAKGFGALCGVHRHPLLMCKSPDVIADDALHGYVVVPVDLIRGLPE